MPSISTITPASFDTGRSVTLTGTGFGSSEGTITIGGVSQTVTSWSDEEITFTSVRGAQSMGACRVDVVKAGSTWQLASGHWVPRKFDAVIAHPRPTAETAVYEQHRNAYPGLAYSTRVLVFGGAYPFRFELVEGPSGMTIGETLVASGDVLVEPSNYGKIEWANPTAGDHTITVRVYDQDYGRGTDPSSYTEVSWTLTVGTSNWVFIDPVNGSNANAGTLAAPFADTTPFITGSTYANKCVMVRQGTMNLVGMSGGNYVFNGDQPGVFVGYPSETATINFNTGHFTAQTAGMALRNLTLAHDVVGYGNSQKMMNQTGTGTHRGVMSDCVITNYNIGTANSNNGGVFVSLTTAAKLQYLCFAYNVLTGNQGPGAHLYDNQYTVVHGNNWHDCTLNGFDGSTHGLVFFKEECMGASVRKNEAWDAVGGTGEDRIFGFMGQMNPAATYGAQNIEFCFNTFYKTGYIDRGATFREYINNISHGDLDNYHFYRNTFGNTNNAEINGQTVTNCTRSFNVLHGGNAFDSFTGCIDSDNTPPGNYVDTSTMKLSGANRTAYLGTHGAEVA